MYFYLLREVFVQNNIQAIQNILNSMWSDYCALNPAAKRIYDLLSSQGETVLNDHIALRTIQHPRLGIESLAKTFKKYGYIEKKDYIFKEKKLYAKHYEHPQTDLPKIFISELELSKVSPFIQTTMSALAEEIPNDLISADHFSYCGRPWKMSFETYSKLAQESEYASWLAAFGFRPNHFTVNINRLKKFSDITILNNFLKQNEYKLNSSGGEIKGSPKEYLEQSSTMASEISVAFSDGSHMVPGCYYEFAKRYALPDGNLYQGFVAASADKIFESTNKLK